jgi:UDP-3-O-[3-hydroxymyristoyl] N-acetylglucosamine deacetylase/3-hydroxyacyl-[acyl-carrier-protein] dehydratase
MLFRRVEYSELPIMDGLSKYFVEALEKAGIEEQNTKRNIYVVKEIIFY